jgi:hypothetical protein
MAIGLWDQECNRLWEGFVLGKLRLGSTVGGLLSWYFCNISAGAGTDKCDFEIHSVARAMIWWQFWEGNCCVVVCIRIFVTEHDLLSWYFLRTTFPLELELTEMQL